MSDIYLSVVIPAYNEGPRLAKTLQEIIAFLRAQTYRSEILVIDDGSADNTSAIAEQELTSFPEYQVLKNVPNQGKGAAVRRGMLEARGEMLLFTDADMSTPIQEVTGFIAALQKDYDVVIGSRAMQGADIVEHQPFFREWMGRIYNFLARLLAFKGIQDSQCGFKCFRREAARDLFRRQKLDRFSFDAEIVFLAQRLGYRLLEKPVSWKNSARSRVSLLSDPLNMFMDLARIRWLHRGESRTAGAVK